MYLCSFNAQPALSAEIFFGRSCSVEAWKEKHNFYKYNCVLKRLHSPSTPSTNTYILSRRVGGAAPHHPWNPVLAEQRSGNIRPPKHQRDQLFYCLPGDRIESNIGY